MEHCHWTVRFVCSRGDKRVADDFGFDVPEKQNPRLYLMDFLRGIRFIKPEVTEEEFLARHHVIQSQKDKVLMITVDCARDATTFRWKKLIRSRTAKFAAAVLAGAVLVGAVVWKTTNKTSEGGEEACNRSTPTATTMRLYAPRQTAYGNTVPKALRQKVGSG